MTEKGEKTFTNLFHVTKSTDEEGVSFDFKKNFLTAHLSSFAAYSFTRGHLLYIRHQMSKGTPKTTKQTSFSVGKKSTVSMEKARMFVGIDLTKN